MLFYFIIFFERLISYVIDNTAYKFMCLDDTSICESRDAEFFETNFPLKKMFDPNNASLMKQDTKQLNYNSKFTFQRINLY